MGGALDGGTVIGFGSCFTARLSSVSLRSVVVERCLQDAAPKTMNAAGMMTRKKRVEVDFDDRKADMNKDICFCSFDGQAVDEKMEKLFLLLESLIILKKRRSPDFVFRPVIDKEVPK